MDTFFGEAFFAAGFVGDAFLAAAGLAGEAFLDGAVFALGLSAVVGFLVAGLDLALAEGFLVGLVVGIMEWFLSV